METTVFETRRARRVTPDVRTLDDLLALDTHALDDVYRRAVTPKIGDLRGDFRGRMLVSPRGGEQVATLTRILAKSSLFPWRGKTFSPLGPEPVVAGEGWNRVLTDGNRWFRFETKLGRSRAGDFDAVRLDYDLPENPFFIRAVQDELREVGPATGLYLGQAWLVSGGRATFAFWFGLS
jgi:hypothetical protein